MTHVQETLAVYLNLFGWTRFMDSDYWLSPYDDTLLSFGRAVVDQVQRDGLYATLVA